MKTLISGLVAVMLVSTAAAPSFAASVSDPDNCAFKDASLCKTESLSPETNAPENTEEPKQVVHLT